jgi:hypothetical protein
MFKSLAELNMLLGMYFHLYFLIFLKTHIEGTGVTVMQVAGMIRGGVA